MNDQQTHSGMYVIFLYLCVQYKLHVNYLAVSFCSNESRTPSQSQHSNTRMLHRPMGLWSTVSNRWGFNHVPASQAFVQTWRRSYMPVMLTAGRHNCMKLYDEGLSETQSSVIWLKWSNCCNDLAVLNNLRAKTKIIMQELDLQIIGWFVKCIQRGLQLLSRTKVADS